MQVVGDHGGRPIADCSGVKLRNEFRPSSVVSPPGDRTFALHLSRLIISNSPPSSRRYTTKMSLRALTRAAPRSAFRFATYSSRTSFRPAVQSASKLRATQIPRCFSTSFRRCDDASQELAAKLNQEISLETEENSSPADSDSNIETFKSQNPSWEIVDTDGEQEVLLKRKYDDEDITVSFNIVDFNTPAYEQEEADEAMMDEEESEIMDHQSGGANTKGAVNQGRTNAGNIKVAPEDSIAPADREGLRNEEDDQEGQPAFPANVNVLVQRQGKVRPDP